jgi:hypothetical protein
MEGGISICGVRSRDSNPLSRRISHRTGCVVTGVGDHSFDDVRRHYRKQHFESLHLVSGNVSVIAGPYAEQVTIVKNVSIVGAVATSTVIQPSTLSLFGANTDSTHPRTTSLTWRPA